MATCAPPRANCRAVARPIPRDPPVTSATRPSNSPGMVHIPPRVTVRRPSYAARLLGEQASGKPRPQLGRAERLAPTCIIVVAGVFGFRRGAEAHVARVHFD